jgi:murein DD-endopeptidase MepM/ murein hydrolase activator NlpD
MGGGSRLELVLPENALEDVESSLIGGVSEPEHFSKPRTLVYNTYTVKKGDYIGNLAIAFGLEDDTLLSVNKVRDSRAIQIGQVLRIPNQDGIMHTVSRGETLSGIAAKYKSDSESIKVANELFSERVNSGTSLFIPGARLDWVTRQEINGDLFVWPVTSRRITSAYGYRSSPFTGRRQFHSGVDIGSPAGTPIRAAMAGRVSVAGWDNTLGNHVVISHHSGYRTLYGHMSVIRVKSGAYVATGERIGDVGSTGQSTAPHLHFTVYKNGVTVNPRTLMK